MVDHPQSLSSLGCQGSDILPCPPFLTSVTHSRHPATHIDVILLVQPHRRLKEFWLACDDGRGAGPMLVPLVGPEA